MRSVVIMGATLIGRARSRFSETAGSRPRLGEAGRRRWRGAHPLAERRGRLADDLLERAAERAQAGEPDLEADVGDAQVALAQRSHGAFDAAALQVAVRRLAERRAERA